MEHLPVADLAARVAAWHNRHPLALRITPAQVTGMGVVALPFLGATADGPDAAHGATQETLPLDAAPAAGDGAAAAPLPVAPEAGGNTPSQPAGAESAQASPPVTAPAPVAATSRLAAWASWCKLSRWRGRTDPGTAPTPTSSPAPAFSHDFLAPIRPQQVARFALRHGLTEWPADALLPLREVVADGVPTAPQRTVYLHTAAIEAHGQRVRVLAGRGPRPAIIGPRLWSRPRSAVAAALFGSGLTALLIGSWPIAARQLALAPAATSAAPAAPAAAPVAVPSPVAASASASASADVATSTPAPAPDIRPRLSAEERQLARAQAEQLRGQGPPAAANGHSFALVTRTTRGRAASEVMLSLMVTAAAGAAWPGQPRTEVLPVPQGWRAVWWPFGSPGDAELARAALARYGINAQIVEF